MLECFHDFIKYNIYLQHLDLQSTGLIVPAIKYITNLLCKAQALRCLHLCGNHGVTEELHAWIRNRIHAKPPEEVYQINPTKHQYQVEKEEEMKEREQEESKQPALSLFQKLLGKQKQED